jgi:hypothetical protein
MIWPIVFEQHRRAILGATILGCWGRVQSADGVIHREPKPPIKPRDMYEPDLQLIA